MRFILPRHAQQNEEAAAPSVSKVRRMFTPQGETNEAQLTAAAKVHAEAQSQCSPRRTQRMSVTRLAMRAFIRCAGQPGERRCQPTPIAWRSARDLPSGASWAAETQELRASRSSD